MDTVWVAYIKDHKADLERLRRKPGDPPFTGEYVIPKMLIGIFDSQEKAERALNIVLQRRGWRGRAYRPNIWAPPDRYEYGWKEIPFNSFNVEELYNLREVIA